MHDESEEARPRPEATRSNGLQLNIKLDGNIGCMGQ